MIQAILFPPNIEVVQEMDECINFIRAFLNCQLIFFIDDSEIKVPSETSRGLVGQVKGNKYLGVEKGKMRFVTVIRGDQ